MFVQFLLAISQNERQFRRQAPNESGFPRKPTHLAIVARFSFKEIAYTTYDDTHETSSTFTFTKM